jgi:hemerythrin
MAAIRWSEAMSVGVPRLDRDHQILIGLINRIDQAQDDENTRNRVLPEVLAILIAYTVFHFNREEKVMEACGYPDLSTHREEHVLLTREVQELQRRFRRGDPQLGRDEILSFLVGWLNHHILLQDMAYRPFAEGSKVADAAAEAHGEFDLDVLLRFREPEEQEHA